MFRQTPMVFVVLLIALVFSGCVEKSPQEASQQLGQQQSVQTAGQQSPQVQSSTITVASQTTEVTTDEGRKIHVTVNWTMPALVWNAALAQNNESAISNAIMPSKQYTIAPGEQITVQYWAFVYYNLSYLESVVDGSRTPPTPTIYSANRFVPADAKVGYIQFEQTLENHGGITHHSGEKRIRFDNPNKSDDQFWSINETRPNSIDIAFASVIASNNDCGLYPMYASTIHDVDTKNNTVTVSFKSTAIVQGIDVGMLHLGSPPPGVQKIPDEYFTSSGTADECNHTVTVGK
ncbi:hypothetical protein CO180_03600 [candidate division WWE3 bacterium CG_4_9_14_3_um_filter_41_6]|uniref:Uncharacterized protein n=1 Tax=candidate division WWE3 bacterium CG_4_10_14_0_2_um_filter_41_14 TaxID=1975072 RepID=A0A2M7THE8_UNCKA|nr:MAG: hypothetical protein COY32_04875 [candidate division WWE3 bacterium CG_4_10_14_0_2_um_filter_41_14]PJA38419.1 MAG: hypothetical protein CO180_03600 [candidate division WWE3 bacterium CG_4_9_14_3_um_filter_41_6]